MKIKFLLRIVGPIIFLLLIYFYVDPAQLKQIILKLKFHFFVLSVILIPVLVLVRSLRWKKILKKINVHYSTWKCFKIYFVGLVTMMVVPTIGTFIKAIYSKRDGHGLANPVLSIIFDKFFDYLLPVVFGLTSAILIILDIQPHYGLAVLLLSACIAFIPSKKAMVLFSTRLIPDRFKQRLMDKGWDLKKRFSEMGSVLDWKIYIISIIGYIVYYLAVYFSCQSLSIGLNFSEVVLIETVTAVIAFIPVSLFGVGIKDAGLVAAFKLFGHTPEEAIALSLTLLLLRIVVVLMGSIFWLMDPPPITEIKQVKKMV
jgi:uncharacterized protein (TIRG00374 family)